MTYTLMFFVYVAATVVFAASVAMAVAKKESLASALRWVGLVAIVAGVGLAVTMMVQSWVETGHPPFRTLYQSLIFFSVTVGLVFLFAAHRAALMGLGTALFIVACLGYGFIKRDVELVQLPPALQSAWFIPHVVVYFLGYAALFVSFVASILYLVFPREKKLPSIQLVGSETVDFNAWTYKSVIFGYAMISAGLILGALWAKFAWGDWWSWDPKENWALVTWLVYTAYLHFRLTSGVTPRTLAWISIIGFAAVMFTYLGVNYLPSAQQALHSYTME
jgi:cytochrome c-type biogenesis protein CcsB